MGFCVCGVPEDESFAEGLAVELGNRLGRIPGLTLVGVTPTRRLAESGADIAAIGAELNVRYLLDATVQRSDSTLRVSPRLTEADSGVQVYADTHEGTREDVFAVQDEIAASVAEALEVTLGVGELGRRPGMTRSYRAYEEFLTAQGINFDTNREDIPRALGHLERAVDIDPSFLVAWLSLASAYDHGALRVPAMGEDWHRLAQQARERVQELVRTAPPDSLPLRALMPDELLERYGGNLQLALSAHDWFALARFHDDVAPLIAEQIGGGVERAGLYFRRGEYLLATGRSLDAMRALEQGRYLLESAQDGNAVGAEMYLAIAYANVGDSTRALEELDRGLAASPDNPTLTFGALYIALGANDREEVRRRAEHFRNGDNPVARFVVEMLGLLDDGATALERIREVSSETPDNEVFPLGLYAHWAAYFEDPRLALSLLRRVDSEGVNGAFVPLMMWHRNFSSVRALPEFGEFVREIGLVDYWRAYAWPEDCRPVGEDEFECG